MADPFVGEIRMFGGTFAPEGWAFCNGQLLAIAENQTLFSLISTNFGGDGQTTFGLPNLQSRVPVHVGGGLTYAQSSGTENVTLTSQQIPVHSHAYNATTNTGNATNPAGALLASSTNTIYRTTTTPPSVALAPSINATGGNQPHPNIMPYLAVSFIISLYGIFPPQN